MPSPFSITAATNSVRLDENRSGETTFTVFNASGRPIRGRARLVTEDPAAQPWISLGGVPERDFSIAGTHQYTVRIAVPPDAPAGNPSFRLDMVGVANPDEEYTQGPSVTFQVPEAAPRRRFPWWILALAGGVLLVILIAVLAFVLWPRSTVVPEVAGMRVSAASAALRQADLEVGEPITETVNVGEAEVVLRTVPPEGQEVPPGTEVILIVAARAAEVVTETPTPSPTPTPPTETPQAPPANLVATVQPDGSVQFTWDDATGESSYNYEFAYVDGAIGAAETNSLPADTTSWTSPILPCDSTGSFVIIALESDGAEIGRASVDFSAPACASGPDLYISELSIDPPNPQSGDTIDVRLGTYNQGNEPAGPYRVTFRYHTTPDSVCEWEVAGNNANGGRILSCSVTVFQPFTAVATTDADDDVDETDEGNNTEEIEIPVPEGTGVDLYISELSVTPANPASGGTVSARVGVYNRGTSAAGGFSVQWRYGIGDFDVCEWDLDSMAARGGRILTCDVVMYASYDTVATADAYEELSESVETNNRRSFPVTVGP